LRAVFLDRDGVLNELVYFPDVGAIDSPLNPRQFRLTPDASKAIRLLNDLGLKVVLVSNQPGVAKGKLTLENLEKIKQKMKRELAKEGAHIDSEYYCLHHPMAARKEYRRNCGCRKPKPGLLLKAARDLNLNLRNSFMVGDSLVDIEAGRAAGCRTVLIGSARCDLCRLMEERNAHPDIIAPGLLTAAKEIEKMVR
jgi:D-glycero-D-manno-heptose 1,7-bisphosphate phosphatase